MLQLENMGNARNVREMKIAMIHFITDLINHLRTIRKVGAQDAVNMVVIPEIEDFVRKYGQSISFTDLRWGMNTDSLDSQQGAHKVLL